MLGAKDTAFKRFLQLPSFSIFIGMFAAGLGQVVMASGADRFLNDRDFVALITWNSFFGIISLLIGSPLVALVIVHTSKENEKFDIRNMQSSAITIGLLVSIFASVAWILGGAKFGHGNQLLPVILLLLSPVYQVHAANQRGLLASSSQWFGVAVQLGSEGLLRGGLVLGFGLVGLRSATLLIFSSWISTVLSVELTYKFFTVDRARSLPGPLSRSVLRLFIPLWISSAAMHLILTLTPNLMALRTNDAVAIGAISIGLFILRIPLTLSSTVFTPIIGPISKAESSAIALSIFRKTLLLTSVFSVTLGTFSFILGPLVMKIVSSNVLLAQSSIVGMLGLASGLFLLAAALHTYLLSRKLMKQISVGWAVTSIVFLLAMVNTRNSAQSVAFIVLISSAIALFSLGVGLASSLKREIS